MSEEFVVDRLEDRALCTHLDSKDEVGFHETALGGLNFNPTLPEVRRREVEGVIVIRSRELRREI